MDHNLCEYLNNVTVLTESYINMDVFQDIMMIQRVAKPFAETGNTIIVNKIST